MPSHSSNSETPPKPFEAHALAEVERLVSLEEAARGELAEAQTELAQSQGEYNDAVKQLAEADAAVEAVRRKLGGSEVPANAEQGGELLHEALIAQQRARARVFEARMDVLAAEDRLALAKADVQARGAALGRARAALERARTRANKRRDWDKVLPSLAELPEQATQTKSEPLFTEAQDKIESETGGLPEPLRSHARARLRAVLEEDREAAEQLVALEDILDALLAETGGQIGELRPFERTLERSEAALGDYVNQAQRWHDEARARLERIATRRTLTPAERAALAETEERTTALEAAQDYGQALTDLAEARRGRELRIAEIYADTEIADPEAAIAEDESVAEYDEAIAAALEAIATYEGSEAAETMRAWEAEVPEFAWADLLDVTLAEHLLDRLAASAPADLITSADAAEAALVEALVRAGSRAERIAALESLVWLADASLERRRETTDERYPAALRRGQR